MISIQALNIFEHEVLDQKLEIGHRELMHQLLTELSGLVRRGQAAGAVNAFKGINDRPAGWWCERAMRRARRRQSATAREPSAGQEHRAVL